MKKSKLFGFQKSGASASKSIGSWYWITLLLAALLFAVLSLFAEQPTGIDNLSSVLYLPNGGLAAVYQEDSALILCVADSSGRQKKTVRFPSNSQTRTVIADIATDDKGWIYLINDTLDSRTGERKRQTLEIYNPDKWGGIQVASYPIGRGTEKQYRWISVSGSVILMSIDSEEKELTRTAYDLETMRSGAGLMEKGERSYTLEKKEGIYDAVVNETDVVYMSKSGKVFLAGVDENAPRELYPARELETVLAPLYLAADTQNTIYMGEQESGDLLVLSPSDGSTVLAKKGTEPLSNNSGYKVADILTFSIKDEQNFLAAVKNPLSGKLELAVSSDGAVSTISQFKQGIGNHIIGFLISFAGSFAVMAAAFLGVSFVLHIFRRGRTILIKLLSCAVPLLLAALVFFGSYSYLSYKNAILENFEKQVVDEGNLLAALFGAESFDEIEYPYDYIGEGYSYLSNQLQTRKTYTRTAYFERSKLYVGVSREYPCFYPFDATLNAEVEKLYELAALTGEAKTGIVRDAAGQRLTCVTPIGGISGGTVYLLETGILISNLEEYTSTYLKNFLMMAAASATGITLLLITIFRYVLNPLRSIKTRLEEYAQGTRGERLPTQTGDELSDIARVFNKMAEDSDLQVYNLKQIEEIYQRFVPQRLIRILGKDTLTDLQAGSSIQGGYAVLSVKLYLRQESSSALELTNLFFNLLSPAAEKSEAMLIADHADLRALFLVCPDGDSAFQLAMSVLAQVDSYNATAGLYKQLNLSFLLHQPELYFGICGSEERYIPALLSQEMKQMTDSCEEIRQLSSRVVVSETAYGKLQSGSQSHRFIGYVSNAQHTGSTGLYDFYASSSPELIRLLNQTKNTFDKAMALYLEERYNDAKNLFAVVLRENQYDNVARHYIFLCEKHL